MLRSPGHGGKVHQRPYLLWPAIGSSLVSDAGGTVKVRRNSEIPRRCTVQTAPVLVFCVGLRTVYMTRIAVFEWSRIQAGCLSSRGVRVPPFILPQQNSQLEEVRAGTRHQYWPCMCGTHRPRTLCCCTRMYLFVYDGRGFASDPRLC